MPSNMTLTCNDFLILPDDDEQWEAQLAVVKKHSLPERARVTARAELSGIVSGAGSIAGRVEVSLDGGKTWAVGQRIKVRSCAEFATPIGAMQYVEGVATEDVMARAVASRESGTCACSGASVRLEVLCDVVRLESELVRTA